MKKNKENNTFICYGISLLFIILSYWVLNNLIFAILNGLYLFLILYKYVFKGYNTAITRISTCEKFTKFSNELIIQLSVTPNINDAFKQLAQMHNEEYNEILLDDSLLVEEKLDSLEATFKTPLYQILKHILLLYVEQGGNILDMSQELLNKCDSELSNMNEIFLMNKHKWSESIVMWIFALVGFIYLRSALISYYVILIKETTFMAIVEIFLIVFMKSVLESSKKYLKEHI